MRNVAVCMALLLTACGGAEPSAEPPESNEPTVFDPLTDTLDRAAGVQDTLNEAAAARRRQLEEQEGR